ncbi:hypothetical protein [Aestuariivirga litoralis]|uniref:hypothetical protein n=1 Tax=Aestuariivirga litoralis TaxID=2650924 RepID=UPI0018C546AF|nr:hypothetical protein [Aestuariivirga litoralis]MBG1230846.1 hypothetical protein [Aestuariivirga litoralis]
MKTQLLWLTLALAASFALPCSAQTTAATDQCETDDPTTYAADCAAAAKLKTALKSNDRQTVANLIDFPLQRVSPLPPIRNAKEFLVHWDEYFDAVTTKQLLDEKPSQYGWRGIAMVNGMVWFKEGRITAINENTAAAEKALKDAKEGEAKALYPAARGYDRLVQHCSTKTLQVRAQKHGDDLRYFAWKRGAPLSGKPQLALRNGTYEDAGSDGHATLTFKNNGYTYQLDNGAGICGEDCNSYLTVLKGQKTVSRQVCK